jgi:hypothetical protein
LGEGEVVVEGFGWEGAGEEEVEEEGEGGGWWV